MQFFDRLPREIICREILPKIDHNTILVLSQCCKFFQALTKDHRDAFDRFERKIIERDANARTKVRTIFEWKRPLVIRMPAFEVLSMRARVSRQKYHVVLEFAIKLTPTYRSIFERLLLHRHSTRKHKREDEFWKVKLREDVLTFETEPMSGGLLGLSSFNALPRKVYTFVKKAVLWGFEETKHRYRYIPFEYATVVAGSRIKFVLHLEGTVSSGLLGKCIGFGNEQNYATVFSKIPRTVYLYHPGVHISVDPI